MSKVDPLTNIKSSLERLGLSAKMEVADNSNGKFTLKGEGRQITGTFVQLDGVLSALGSAPQPIEVFRTAKAFGLTVYTSLH